MNIIHRPEEALDIRSELIFVNGMVYLPQEWNFGRSTTLPSPATPPSPLTATPEAIFFVYVTSCLWNSKVDKIVSLKLKTCCVQNT